MLRATQPYSAWGYSSDFDPREVIGLFVILTSIPAASSAKFERDTTRIALKRTFFVRKNPKYPERSIRYAGFKKSVILTEAGIRVEHM